MSQNPGAAPAPAPSHVNPWDQQAGETSTAFAAFETYLKLGVGRRIKDAYRLHSGKPNALQASGRFTGWASGYRWAERARAYDRALRADVVQTYIERDLNDHLDTYRATLIEGAESNLKLCSIAEVKLHDALAGLDLSGAKVTEVTAMIRALKDLREASQDTLGAALGVHHLLTMLQGDGIRPGTSAAAQGGSTGTAPTDTAAGDGASPFGTPGARA